MFLRRSGTVTLTHRETCRDGVCSDIELAIDSSGTDGLGALAWPASTRVSPGRMEGTVRLGGMPGASAVSLSVQAGGHRAVVYDIVSAERARLIDFFSALTGYVLTYPARWRDPFATEGDSVTVAPTRPLRGRHDQ